MISPDNRWPCKVGISQNPSKRVTSIQTSCWRRVDIAEYRYCANSNQARAVEKKVHDTLTADGILMHGEWFDIRPDKALDIIEFSAMTLGVELRHDIPDDQLREKLRGFCYSLMERHMHQNHDDFDAQWGVDGSYVLD